MSFFPVSLVSLVILLAASIIALKVGIKNTLREYLILSIIHFAGFIYALHLTLSLSPAIYLRFTIFGLLLIFATLVRKGEEKSRGLVFGFFFFFTFLLFHNNVIRRWEFFYSFYPQFIFEIYTVVFLFLAYFRVHPLRNTRDIVIVRFLWGSMTVLLALSTFSLFYPSISPEIDFFLISLVYLATFTTLKKNAVIFTTKQAIAISRKIAEETNKEDLESPLDYFKRVIHLIR